MYKTHSMHSWHSGDFTELEFRFGFGYLREEEFCMQKVKSQYTQNHDWLTDKSYKLFSSNFWRALKKLSVHVSALSHQQNQKMSELIPIQGLFTPINWHSSETH